MCAPRPPAKPCSSAARTSATCLNAAGVTWGFFEGGFNLSIVNANGTTGCKRSTTSTVTNIEEGGLHPASPAVPVLRLHRQPDATRGRPRSATIGHNGDAANHQYDIQDFFAAVSAGNFPAVSYLKAPGYQDGHAGYSDPLDEQNFVVTVINFLQKQRDWESTAVIIAYDDSDGWYDHHMGPIVNQSSTDADALTGVGACGNGATALARHQPRHAARAGPLRIRAAAAADGDLALGAAQLRRSHVTDQTSILRFVEDNWLGGAAYRPGLVRRDRQPDQQHVRFRASTVFNTAPFMLDPSTGEPVRGFRLVGVSGRRGGDD